MLGANEKPNAGDPDGTGTSAFLIDLDKNRLCYTLQAANIPLPATAAHIHRGDASISGPVVIPFTQPGAARHLLRLRRGRRGAAPRDHRQPGGVLLEHPLDRVPGRRRPRAALDAELVLEPRSCGRGGSLAAPPAYRRCQRSPAIQYAATQTA